MVKKETELSVLKEIRDCIKGKSPICGDASVANTNTRFIRNADGSFTDKQLSIVWAKEDLPKKMNFNEAQKACKALGEGWRPASDKEMESLIDRSKYNPAIISEAIVLGLKTDYYYWTSTPYAGDSDGAWCVNFNVGIVNYYGKGCGNYVRAVRSSQ
jgi:hypothetical protein